MSTLIFVVVATGDDVAGYGASFPDFPGAECRGADLGELLSKARGVILARLQALSDAGEAWPTPAPMATVAAPPPAIATLVDVTVDDPPVRVNISMGERLLERLDAAAEARSMTRSGFIAHAVRVSLGERPGERPAAAGEFDDMGRRIQDELTALGRRINESIGPESAFTRRMVELDDYVFDGVRKAADSVSAAMSRRRGGGYTWEYGQPRPAASPDQPASPHQPASPSQPPSPSQYGADDAPVSK